MALDEALMSCNGLTRDESSSNVVVLEVVFFQTWSWFSTRGLAYGQPLAISKPVSSFDPNPAEHCEYRMGLSPGCLCM